MIFSRRTDLAVEAREIWAESADKQTELPGIKAQDFKRQGYNITKVDILDERGERGLGKPCGTYITLELNGFARREDEAFNRAVTALAETITPMLALGRDDGVMVVGLGNIGVTPDAVGPKVVENTMVTRHLVSGMPEFFGNFRQVSALTPGVLGTTGLESAEVVKGVIDRSKPQLVIVIDALASRKLSRLCTTIQITDTGIVPGSGVGNSRAAFNRASLGIPVLAIGVPTVVDIATLAADIAEESGAAELDPERLRPFGGDMIVTPKEIDTHINDISKVIGYAINIALHKGVNIDDVTAFLS